MAGRARAACPAEGPYIEVEVPTAVDPTLTDDGTTILTMFTQYGPWSADDWADGDREAYGERCFGILAEHAPNVPDAILDYEVLAPPDLERIFGLEGGSIFQGEQGLDQMAFMRPTPGARPLRDAGARPLPVRRRARTPAAA